MLPAMPRPPVDVETVHAGDVVLVSSGGRVFHATVRGRGVGGFAIDPHDRGVRVRRARLEEVVEHWMRAERAQAIADGQLSLEDLAR